MKPTDVALLAAMVVADYADARASGDGAYLFEEARQALALALDLGVPEENLRHLCEAVLTVKPSKPREED